MIQKARIMNVVHAIYNCLFSFTYTLPFCRKRKSFCDHCFPQQIRPRNTVQLYILQDYLSGIIGFNMNNKHHPLPIVYTILVRMRKFQSLLFNSELNELRGSYVWILKSAVSILTKSNLLVAPIFWIADYRRVFRILPNT